LLWPLPFHNHIYDGSSADAVLRSSCPYQRSDVELRSLRTNVPQVKTTNNSPTYVFACNESSNPAFEAHNHSRVQTSVRKHRLPTPSSITPLLQLTEAALANYNEQYNDLDVLFDTDVRERAVQEAGRKMGFNLKLDCYEADKQEFMEWYETQKTLFRERPIFKYRQDLAEMGEIAMTFGAALENAMKVERET
jgi:hypothetical protein